MRPRPNDRGPAGHRPSRRGNDRRESTDELFRHTEVLVCNGGFGSVLSALHAGVPVVGPGKREGKNDNNARIAHRRLGVDLRTEHPKPGQVAAAVEQVLGDPVVKANVRRLRSELDAYDTMAIVADAIAEAVPAASFTGCARVNAISLSPSCRSPSTGLESTSRARGPHPCPRAGLLAARVRRIGPTCAYELAQQVLHAEGAAGLKVMDVGRQLRVPLTGVRP